MKRILTTAALILGLSPACSSDDKTTADVCDGVTCSGHGTCASVSGAASCTCDSGYVADGLTCVESVACEGAACNPDGLNLFVDGSIDDTFKLRIGGADNWTGIDVVGESASIGTTISATRVNGKDTDSAVQVVWQGGAEFYAGTPNGDGVDLTRFLNTDTSIKFRIRVDQAPEGGTVVVRVDYGWPHVSELPFGSILNELDDGAWHDYSIPLDCFVNGEPQFDAENINRAILFYSDTPMTISLEDIQWVPGGGAGMDCSDFFRPVDEPTLSLYGDGGVGTGFALTGWAGFTAPHVTDDEVDIGGGEMVWATHLLQGSTTVIRPTGHEIDMSAYTTSTAKLMFDVMVVDYRGHESDSTDVLIKITSRWPYVSDMRLFSEILEDRPTANVWQRDVTVMMSTLLAADNEIDPLDFNVNVHRVSEVFNVEVRGDGFVDGVDGIELYFDNIRWVK
ncbi:MAG: hypothetical protein IPK13_07730 [Deltaproteobacteria bacterium]|nr:hypothetical protein [Deltaproteobacteria bacterium]